MQTDNTKRWQPGGLEWDAGRSLYRVSADGGLPERVDDEAADELAPMLASGDLSPDRRSRIVSKSSTASSNAKNHMSVQTNS